MQITQRNRTANIALRHGTLQESLQVNRVDSPPVPLATHFFHHFHFYFINLCVLCSQCRLLFLAAAVS